MIIVTRLDGRHFAVNPDLVERIFESPDTTLVMADGGRFIVTETMLDVIEKIARFRARVIAIAYNAPDDSDDADDDTDDEVSVPDGRGSPRLSIIHPAGTPGGNNIGRA